MALTELFTNIANAIRGKDGTTATIAPTDFASRISAIETGVDTSDATATASDMANGVTAYVNGEKVTGNVATFSFDPCHIADSIRQSDPYIVMTKSNNPNQLYRAGTGISVVTDKSNFGDATAADVANGKTFTSSAGLKVTGTGSTSHYFIVHVADVDLGSASASITFTIDNVMIKDDIASGYACHGMAFLVYGDLLNGNYDITSAEVSYDGSDTWEAYTMNTAALLANMSKKATCSYNNSTGELTITSYRSDYKFVAGTWCLAMSFR